jgi:hypothetical protein
MGPVRSYCVRDIRTIAAVFSRGVRSSFDLSNRHVRVEAQSVPVVLSLRRVNMYQQCPQICLKLARMFCRDHGWQP